MDDIVVVTLFRHGLTEGNKRRAYMGWNDSPLSEEGKVKVRSYGLKQEDYDYFLSSDIDRCITTMKLLFPDVEPQLFLTLREMNFGVFQGKTYQELKDIVEYQRWLDDFLHISPPEGESFRQFSDRVMSGWDLFIEKITSNDLKSPFIVTHGGVIRHLLSQFAPDEKGFWDWQIAHGSGVELVFDRERLRRKQRCILLREVPLTAKEPG